VDRHAPGREVERAEGCRETERELEIIEENISKLDRIYIYLKKEGGRVACDGYLYRPKPKAKV